MARRAWLDGGRIVLAVGLAGVLALPALAQTPPPARTAPPVPRTEPGGPPKSPAPPAGAAPAPARAPYALNPADAAGTPPLQPGRAVSLTLRRGQQAFFRVAPEAGEAWSVSTRRLGEGTDTVLAILDAAGTVIVEDDDGGTEGLASQVEIQPGDGAALVRAGTLEDAGGRFELVLTQEAVLPPPDFATTAEQAAQRPPLAPGQPVRVRLRRDQQAFFALPADRASLIALTRDLSRNADTVLALVDASGRVLAENDDGGQGLASLLEVSGGEGAVFLRAALLGGIGSFEVMLEREAPTPAPDYPTDLEQARARGPVAAGQRIQVALGRNRQAFFALPPGTALTLSTTGLTAGADTVLALLDERGDVILEDDDGGEGLASRLRTSDGGGRAAFVRASLLNGARGGFALVVAETQAAAAAPEGTAGSLEEARRRPTPIPGEAIRLRLERDQEVYIPLPHDGRPALAMTFDLEDGLDTVLALLDEGGAVLAENDDAEGLASRLEVPAGPRPAFLRVKALDGAAGAFSLVLVRPAP